MNTTDFEDRIMKLTAEQFELLLILYSQRFGGSAPDDQVLCETSA